MAVGDRVKLTGKFLRSTGQALGAEGASVWTVKAIRGEFVVTDQPIAFDCWTPEEHAADPLLKFRRINAANVFKVGTVTADNA